MISDSDGTDLFVTSTGVVSNAKLNQWPNIYEL